MGSSDSPLTGLRVVELAGLAPAPFAGLFLADFGASVLRVDRPPTSTSAASTTPNPDQLTRHKASIVLDLKNFSSLSLLRSLLKRVDVLIDPYRPGTLEALGLRPNELIMDSPRMIIARLTGFRRDGKYKDMAGHDINYLAVSGILSQLGRKGHPPYAPANILADFAGGGLMCVVGILLALIKRAQTGKGQVIESNMVDGSAYLGTFMRLSKMTPLWDQPRGENILDGGCPWYDVYECKGGGYMAVGALEAKFRKELMRSLEIGHEGANIRMDRARWPQLREVMKQKFQQKTRTEWESVFDGKDSCCTPVLDQLELEEAGYEQRPAVKLSESPGLEIPTDEAWVSTGLPPSRGGEKILRDWMEWEKGQDFVTNSNGLFKIHHGKL